MPKHQLIGAPVSLYTGKARAYLRYKAIPFEEVLSSKDVYRDVILPRTGVRFIPVLISDDDIAVQDTTEIIDFLEQRYPEAPVYPSDPVQRLVALLFEVYGDEWLVIPAMHYRWNIQENREFSIAEFGRVSAPEASPEEQQRIGEKNAGPFAGALPPLGISEATAPAVEASYKAFLTDFDAHLAHHPFLLGTRPSIGDYGLMGPLYAHLYRDPASGRLMKEHAPRVAEWVERMNAPEPRGGAFLDDDHVPETLYPILARMFREQGPVLANTIDAVANWAAENDGVELPRGIGKHSFQIENTEGTRVIYPFNQWMWQRAHDAYHALDEDARQRADTILQATGGSTLMHKPIPQRVAREQNKLVVVR